MEHYTIEAYFTKLVELEGDKHPNLTVENLLRLMTNSSTSVNIC